MCEKICLGTTTKHQLRKIKLDFINFYHRHTFDQKVMNKLHYIFGRILQIYCGKHMKFVLVSVDMKRVLTHFSLVLKGTFSKIENEVNYKIFQ